MKAHCSNPAEVRAFCEQVADRSTKSLNLLAAIDSTINWLVSLQNHAQADLKYAASLTEEVRNCSREPAIDVDGDVVAAFEKAEEVLSQLHQKLAKKRDAATRASELDGDDKETIVEEYKSTIAAIADLHNAFVELRWSIMEHDAELSKETGVFEDADRLIAHLNR